MLWVRLPHERPCSDCRGGVERFIYLMKSGKPAMEVTFCAACSPEVKRVVDSSFEPTHLETTGEESASL